MGQTNELLSRMAEHNQFSNEEMLRVIEDGLPDPWNFELKGYHFKTLGQILDHGYVTDVNWMCHLFESSQEIIDIGPKIERLDHRACHFSSFADYRLPRRMLDQKIVDFFRLVEEDQLTQNVDERSVGRVVPWLPAIHLFHHQTHHRGQISFLLDSLAIVNDYSSILRI